jgi:hypothetical protein
MNGIKAHPIRLTTLFIAGHLDNEIRTADADGRGRRGDADRSRTAPTDKASHVTHGTEQDRCVDVSFLGFGVSPPTPDWGLMVADSRTYLPIAPWAGLYPILFLSTLIIGINLTADALAKTLGVDKAQKAPI